MAVSEERIDELMVQMLTNADEDGWCHIPDGLDKEEIDELTKRLTIMTMQDRIDSLMESILDALNFMSEVKNHLDGYDTMERLKLKGALNNVIDDSQTILIDLHSDNKINDFFKIDLIISEDENAKKEAGDARLLMEDLINNEFNDSLKNIKRYCESMIEMSNELIEKLKLK